MPISNKLKIVVDAPRFACTFSYMDEIKRFKCAAERQLSWANEEVRQSQQNMKWVEDEASQKGLDAVTEHVRYKSASARIRFANERKERELAFVKNHKCSQDARCAILAETENGTKIS